MPASEAERDAALKAWQDWYLQLEDAVVDAGAPFRSLALTVDSDGTVRDAKGENVATGYAIVQADTADQVVQMARECPILRSGGRIAIYETFVMGEP